jgi:hypothetical protein
LSPALRCRIHLLRSVVARTPAPVFIYCPLLTTQSLASPVSIHNTSASSQPPQSWAVA